MPASFHAQLYIIPVFRSAWVWSASESNWQTIELEAYPLDKDHALAKD